MKLNIGSGYKRYPGYLNVDNDKNCNPDYLVNIDDVNLILPFDDNSIDDIRMYHILEHVGQGFFRLLQELYRVSKPGTIWDIALPYPRHDVAIIDPTHVRMILPETFRLFSKKHNQLEIERGGSSSTLGLIYDIDLELVDYDFHHDAFYDNIVPTLSDQMRQRLFREALNVTIESKCKVMVVK